MAMWLHTGEDPARPNKYVLFNESGRIFVPNGGNSAGFIDGTMLGNFLQNSKTLAMRATWGSNNTTRRANVIAQLTAAKINYVRAVIYWNAMEGAAPTRNANGTLTHTWDTIGSADFNQMSNIRQCIKDCKDAGLRVMLDLHTKQGTNSFPGWIGDTAPGFYLNNWTAGKDLSSLGAQPTNRTTYPIPAGSGAGLETTWGPISLWVEVLKKWTSMCFDPTDEVFKADPYGVLDNMVCIDIQNEPQPATTAGVVSPDIIGYRNFVRLSMARCWTINPKVLVSYEQCIGARFLSNGGVGSRGLKIYFNVGDMPTDMKPQDFDAGRGLAPTGTGRLYQYHSYPNGEPTPSTISQLEQNKHAGGIKANYALANAAHDAFVLGEHEFWTSIHGEQVNQIQLPGTPNFVAGNPDEAIFLGGRGNAGDHWDSTAPSEGGMLDWFKANKAGQIVWSFQEGDGGCVVHSYAVTSSAQWPAGSSFNAFCQNKVKDGNNNNVDVKSWLAFLYVSEGPADTTPPTTVSGLARTNTSTGADLTWNQATDAGGIAGYKVYVGASGSEVVHDTVTGDASSPAFSIALTSGSTYRITVKAFDNAGNLSTAFSNAVSVTPTTATDTTAPTAPTALSATNTSDGADLTWTASSDPGTPSSGVAGYKIWRGAAGSEVLIADTATTDVAYTITGLAAGGATYRITISAYDAASPANQSTKSASVTITPTGAVPDTTAPTTPGSFTNAGNTTDGAVFTWTASTDAGGSGLHHYAITRGATGTTAVTTVLAGTNTVTLTGFSAGVSYNIWIQAFDGAGNGSTKVGPVTMVPTGVTAAPTFGSLSASTLLTGQTVTFTGTNLSTVTAVSLAGQTITSFTLTSTTVVFTIPDNGVTGVITVSNPGGPASSGTLTIPNTYVVAAADLGKTVTCVVTATGTGGSTAVASNAIVVGGVPVNTAVPVIVGSSVVTATLAALNPGSWTNSPTTFSYQWRQDGVDIVGESGVRYTVLPGDAGHSLTCAVTATNGAGDSTAAVSNALAIPSGPGATSLGQEIIETMPLGNVLGNVGVAIVNSGIVTPIDPQGAKTFVVKSMRVKVVTPGTSTAQLACALYRYKFAKGSWLIDSLLANATFNTLNTTGIFTSDFNTPVTLDFAQYQYAAIMIFNEVALKVAGSATALPKTGVLITGNLGGPSNFPSTMTQATTTPGVAPIPYFALLTQTGRWFE